MASDTATTHADVSPEETHVAFSDFNTAMSHFYRGEVYRSSIWRMRLDATTNWAVISTGGALSFAFSAPGHTHLIFLATALLVCILLLIEARRFRFFDVWRVRVRLIEENFYVPHLLQSSCCPRADWRKHLAQDLLQPRFKMSMGEAVARRLLRDYLWINLVVYVRWLIKLGIHPQPARSFLEMVEHASAHSLSGWRVFVAFILYNVMLIALVVWTAFLQQDQGEIHEPRSGLFWSRPGNKPRAESANVIRQGPESNNGEQRTIDL